ncbi:hypothetical protein B0H21DRAFT_828127 [Amylocystis lapponica]|nr:hypothetical protein B0H21DRAFT_828127 [Amylocystis lapponica]
MSANHNNHFVCNPSTRRSIHIPAAMRFSPYPQARSRTPFFGSATFGVHDENIPPVSRTRTPSPELDNVRGDFREYISPAGAYSGSQHGINALVDKMGISTHREEVHGFAALSLQEMMIQMYASNLAKADAIEAIKTSLVKILMRLEHLEKLNQENWKPSEIQQTLLKGLLGHFLVKPIESYARLYSRVGTFIYRKAEWLHLGLYLTDPIVRVTIDTYLSNQCKEIKSNFRKQIVASVTGNTKKPLELFTRDMVNKYHLPIVPHAIPQDIMAAMRYFAKLPELGHKPQ